MQADSTPVLSNMRLDGTFYLARSSPLEKKFSIDLLYSVSASDQKSCCNTPESNFSLTFYNKTAGTLVSSRSVELQVS